MRRLLLSGVMVVGVLSGFVQGGTVAYFTSSATSAGNQFTAGTLVISEAPSLALLNVSNLVPGDSFGAPLTVSNAGSLTLRYAVTSAADNTDGKGLRSALGLTIWTDVSAANCTAKNYTGGTSVYGPGALGDDTGLSLIGNPAQGQHAGDRAMAPSTDEVLCFAVQLPSGTSTALQGASTSATFSFSAEQVSGN